METAKLGLRGIGLALTVLVLFAVVVLIGGPAAHGEEAAAPAVLQAETASPPTGPISTTGGITETPLLPPLELPTTTVTPTDTATPTPTATPSPKPTATRTATAAPTASPEPTDTTQAGRPSRSRQHYVRGNSNVVFQWGMLVDSLALGISYAWLIGGLVVGIGLPIALVVWWLRNRRRRPARE